MQLGGKKQAWVWLQPSLSPTLLPLSEPQFPTCPLGSLDWLPPGATLSGSLMLWAQLKQLCQFCPQKKARVVLSSLLTDWEIKAAPPNLQFRKHLAETIA